VLRIVPSRLSLETYDLVHILNVNQDSII
jgi:hypothetical protein